MTGFPSQVIKRHHKVLSLFVAAFGGKQDVEHIRKAGVQKCVMVDIDASKLNKMNYDYSKICGDCFEIIDVIHKTGEQFDVVTSDHWTGQDEAIHGIYFEKLCAIAPIRILGISQKYLNTLNSLPEGLYYKRSDFNGGVFWRLHTDKK